MNGVMYLFLFAQGNRSIMEDVATGKNSKSGEMVVALAFRYAVNLFEPVQYITYASIIMCICVFQMPMVLKIPHFRQSLLMVCASFNYSILGFGDIVVPGTYAGAGLSTPPTSRLLCNC